MSNPQLENGYLRIANELLEAIIRAGLSKREYQVVLAVIRKTYGYGKKRDEISLSQLQAMTGIYPSHLSKTVIDLVSAGVLLKQSGVHANSLMINKRYAEWRLLPKRSGVTETVSDQNSNKGVTESVQNLLPNQSLQKTTQKTTPKERGTRSRKCPLNFWPTDEMFAAMRDECPGVDLVTETRSMMDHDFEKPKSDWAGTWRNWIRKAKKFNGAKHGKQTPGQILTDGCASAFDGLAGGGSAFPEIRGDLGTQLAEPLSIAAVAGGGKG